MLILRNRKALRNGIHRKLVLGFRVYDVEQP